MDEGGGGSTEEEEEDVSRILPVSETSDVFVVVSIMYSKRTSGSCMIGYIAIQWKELMDLLCD
jgi:hypothetical protein